MIANCEDLLICDLAETYGIYDYKAMKPSLIATLAVGLPVTSRIVREYSGISCTPDQMLLAMIEDSLNNLIYGLRGKKGGKRPQSVFKQLTKGKEKKDELMSFSTPEEYEAWKARKKESWNHG